MFEFDDCCLIFPQNRNTIDRIVDSDHDDQLELVLVRMNPANCKIQLCALLRTVKTVSVFSAPAKLS